MYSNLFDGISGQPVFTLDGTTQITKWYSEAKNMPDGVSTLRSMIMFFADKKSQAQNFAQYYNRINYTLLNAERFQKSEPANREFALPDIIFIANLMDGYLHMQEQLSSGHSQDEMDDIVMQALSSSACSEDIMGMQFGCLRAKIEALVLLRPQVALQVVINHDVSEDHAGLGAGVPDEVKEDTVDATSDGVTLSSSSSLPSIHSISQSHMVEFFRDRNPVHGRMIAAVSDQAILDDIRAAVAPLMLSSASGVTDSSSSSAAVPIDNTHTTVQQIINKHIVQEHEIFLQTRRSSTVLASAPVVQVPVTLGQNTVLAQIPEAVQGTDAATQHIAIIATDLRKLSIAGLKNRRK
jgi:hypothetical protein